MRTAPLQLMFFPALHAPSPTMHAPFHACSLPCTPPAMHAHLPCAPSATRATHHACPPAMHTPYHACPPAMHAPLPCMPPCYARPLSQMPAIMHAPLPLPCMPPPPHLWTEFLTHACKKWVLWKTDTGAHTVDVSRKTKKSCHRSLNERLNYPCAFHFSRVLKNILIWIQKFIIKYWLTETFKTKRLNSRHLNITSYGK